MPISVKFAAGGMHCGILIHPSFLDLWCLMSVLVFWLMHGCSKLAYEVVEAVSSLVFAASRCGELPELNRIRSLFRKHFGNEFERVNVELQPGNFVNSQIKYNLGNNSISDDLKLQMTSEIAGECTPCLQPDQIIEENFVPPYESLVSKIGDVRDNSNGKPQRQASKIKDMVCRIGSKISKSGSRNLILNPIQEKLIVYLDDSKDESSRTEDVNVRKVPNGLSSQNMNVSSKGNNVIKKNLAQMGDQTMLSKEGLPRCKTYSGRRLERNEESKPRLSYVHPKLPDYDELVATFTEYKEEYMKRNSNDRTLYKWMRLF